jgi:hypothetical protein
MMLVFEPGLDAHLGRGSPIVVAYEGSSDAAQGPLQMEIAKLRMPDGGLQEERSLDGCLGAARSRDGVPAKFQMVVKLLPPADVLDGERFSDAQLRKRLRIVGPGKEWAVADTAVDEILRRFSSGVDVRAKGAIDLRGHASLFAHDPSDVCGDDPGKGSGLRHLVRAQVLLVWRGRHAGRRPGIEPAGRVHLEIHAGLG